MWKCKRRFISSVKFPVYFFITTWWIKYTSAPYSVDLNSLVYKRSGNYTLENCIQMERMYVVERRNFYRYFLSEHIFHILSFMFKHILKWSENFKVYKFRVRFHLGQGQMSWPQKDQWQCDNKENREYWILLNFVLNNPVL